jgi:exonuclease VII small subunit
VDTLGIIRQMESDPALRAQLRAVLLGDEVLRLPELVAENTRDIRDMKDAMLAVERRLVRLEKGQANLEKGQANLEKGQAGLKQSMERLEDRQDRVEQGLERLEKGHASLRKEVGRLAEVVGGTVEEDASSVVVTVLERRGWNVHGIPQPVQVNGEIDVLAHASSPQGEDVPVLVEAKTRLRPADVRRFAAGLDGLAAAAGITGSYLSYVYGLRVYTGVDEAARELGLGLLCPDGELVEPLPRSA